MEKSFSRILFMTPRRVECCSIHLHRRKKNASHLMAAMIYSHHLIQQTKPFSPEMTEAAEVRRRKAKYLPFVGVIEVEFKRNKNAKIINNSACFTVED